MTSYRNSSILVTGFEPFGDDDRNPTQVIVDRLGGVVLPTAYAAATVRLHEVLDELQPRALLLCGLHALATGLVIERQAINEDRSTLPDNSGDTLLGQPIDPAGPMALPATASLDPLAAALDAAGLPWQWSDSAGRFICNHVYYRALRRGMCCVFLHVPWPSDWEMGRPGILTLSQIETGIRACAAVLEDATGMTPVPFSAGPVGRAPAPPGRR